MAGMNDLNKMFKRGQRTRRKVPFKAQSWLTNAAKSFGYAASDVLEEIMPNTISIAASAAEVANDIRAELLEGKTQSKKITDTMNLTTYLNMGREYKKNFLEDLKTGKFYNKEREANLIESELDSAMGDLGIDFGDNDEDFDVGEDDDFDFTVSSDNGNATANIKRKSKGRNEATQIAVFNNFDEDSPIVQSTNFQTKVQIEATGVLVDTQKASTQAMVTMMSGQHKQTLATMASLNSTVEELHSVVGENLTRISNMSEKYYSDSMDIYGKMLEELGKIRESTSVTAAAAASFNLPKEYQDVLDMFSGGMVNISDYKKFVTKNVDKAINDNLFASTIRNMLTDESTLKSIIAAPLKGTVKNLTQQLLPQMVQMSIKQFDDTLGETLIAGLTKVGSWSDSSNPLLSTLGQIFGIKNKMKASVDKQNYVKGAVQWDGIARRALVDVIPMYLRRIESALSGRPEVVFDYENGVYKTLASVEKEAKDLQRDKILSSFSTDTTQFNEFLAENFAGSREEKLRYAKGFQDFLYNMARRGGISNYRVIRDKNGSIKQDELADVLGMRTGEDVVEMIRGFIEGRYMAGDAAENMRMLGRSIQEARMNLTSYMNERELDPFKYNDQYVNNGLDPVSQEKPGVQGSNYGKSAAGIGGVSSIDKFKQSSTDYLRKTYETLNRGIKVFVTNWNGGYLGNTISDDASEIVTKSKRELDELAYKKKTYVDAQTKYNNVKVGSLTDAELERAVKAGKVNLSEGSLNYDLFESMSSQFHGERLQDDLEERKANVLERLSKRYNFAKRASQFIDSTSEKTQTLFKSANDFLYSLIYGFPDGKKGKGALLSQLILSMKASFKKFGSFLDEKILKPLDEKLFGDDGLFKKLSDTEFAKDLKAKTNQIMDAVLGVKTKDEKGNITREGGILSSTVNELGNIGKEVKAFVFGGKDANGNKIDPKDDHSVLGEAKRMFRTMASNITGAMGLDVKPDQSFSDQVKVKMDDIWGDVKTRVSSWSDTLFGPATDSDRVETARDAFNEVRSELKGAGGKVGASAVIGGVSSAVIGSHMGLLGSIFLPGGPIGGALIGAGVGIVKNSSTLQRFLFGETDKDGNYSPGLISKDIQDFFKNNSFGIKAGAFAGTAAALGLIPSFFVPGGPIGGALIGGAISVAAKSEAFNDLLYGEGGTKDDPTGGIYKKFKDIFGKDTRTKDLAIEVGIGSGVGLIGSFFLPGGPITGALLGGAAAIALNMDSVKKVLFGDGSIDEATGKTNRGLLGKFEDTIQTKVLRPFIQSAKIAQVEFVGFIKKEMVGPLVRAMAPITNRLKKIGISFEDGIRGFFRSIGDKFTETVLTPIGEKLDKILDPFKKAANKIFKGILRFAGSVISAPFKFIEGVAQGITKQDMKSGRQHGQAEERAKLRNEQKDIWSSDASFGSKLASSFKLGWQGFGRVYNAGKEGQWGPHGASYASADDNIWTQKRDYDAKIDAEIAAKKAAILNGADPKKVWKDAYDSFLAQGVSPEQARSFANETVPDGAEKPGFFTRLLSGKLGWKKNPKVSKSGGTTVTGEATPKTNEEKISDATAETAANTKDTSSILSDIKLKMDEVLSNIKGSKPSSSDDGTTKVAGGTPSGTSGSSGNIGDTEYDDSSSPSGGRVKVSGARTVPYNKDRWKILNRVDSNISKIRDSVDGQLDGVGSNVYKTYKLLLKAFGFHDKDIKGKNNKDRGNVFRRGIGGIFRFLASPFRKASGVISGFFRGLGEAAGSLAARFGELATSVAVATLELLKLPFKIADGILTILKAVGPIISKTIVKTVDFVGTMLVSGAKALSSVLIETAQGFGSLVGGLLSGIGTFAKGAGILGKELFVGGAKAFGFVGSKLGGLLGGIFNTGGAIAHGVFNRFKKKGPKSADNTVWVLGGTLDLVKKVELVEEVSHVDRVSTIESLKDGLVRFGPMPVAGGGYGFVGDLDGDGETDDVTKVAGSGTKSNDKEIRKQQEKQEYEERVARNSSTALATAQQLKDDRIKEEDFRTNLLALLDKKNQDDEQFHMDWRGMFGKAGLLTLGLFAAFLLFKKIKTSIVGLVQDIGNDFAANGGFLGLIKKLFGKDGDSVSSRAGAVLTGEKRGYATENGHYVQDENGNYVIDKKKVGLLGRFKNLIGLDRQRIDHHTGEVYTDNSITNLQGAWFNTGKNLMVKGGRKLGKQAMKMATTPSMMVPFTNINTSAPVQKMGTKILKTSNTLKRTLFGDAFGDMVDKETFKTVGRKAVGRGATMQEATQLAIDSVSGVQVGGTNKGIFGKAAKVMKDAIGTLKNGVLDFLSRHNCKSFTKITELFNRVYSALDDKVLSKILPKFKTKILQMSAKSFAFALDLGFAAIGALSANPAAVFHVRSEDVDWKMQLIARTLRGLLSTSIGGWIDLASQLVYSLIGIDFVGEVACAMYRLISSEEDSEKLNASKDEFRADYEAYLQEEYAAYVKNETEAGNTPMDYETWKRTGDVTSFDEYNSKTNRTLVQKAINYVPETFGRAKRYIKGKYNDAKTTVATGWNQFKSGDFKGLASTIGTTLNNHLNPVKSTTNLVKGIGYVTGLDQTKLWKGAVAMKDKATATMNGFFNKVKGFFGDKEAKQKADAEKATSGVSTVKTSMTMPGTELMVYNTKQAGSSNKTKRAWFDPSGAFYVKNPDGTFNYYNALGDPIAENVDDPVIDANIAAGLFRLGDIPEGSRADRDSKESSKGLSSFWSGVKSGTSLLLKKAKNFASGIAGKVSNWWEGFKNKLGIGSNENTEENTTGGMGSGRSRVAGGYGSPASKNGFAYYSQNDPNVKDQSYNMSDGSPDTMGNRGCGPTAMAMVASQLTGHPVKPKDAAKLATDGGFSTNVGTEPEYFNYAAKKYGLRSTQVAADAKSVAESLVSGYPVILQGQSNDPSSPYTKAGHYVVGTGIKDGKILVNDPNGASKSKAYSMDQLLHGAGNMWSFGTGGNDVISATAMRGGRADGPEFMNGFPYLSQSDSRWGNKPYTVINDPGQTFTASACGPTSMAMVLRSFGYNVSPVDTVNWSLEHGYRTANSGTSWGYFPAIAKEYGLNTTELGKNGEAISNALAAGKPIIGTMGPGVFTKGGHFIVLSGADQDGIMVNDPSGSKGMERSNKRWPLSIFLKQGKNFWSFDKNGQGSIGNVADAGTISVAQGTPGATSASGSTAPNTYGDMGSKKFTSIGDMLSGLADAALKPFYKAFGFDFDTDTSATGMSSGGMSTTGVDLNNLPDIQLAGNGYPEQVWNYFKTLGYSDQTVAGILGNMHQESGVNPTVVQKGSGHAAGIAQWESYKKKSGRWKAMADYAASKGKDWTDLKSQLDWLVLELQGKDSCTANLLKKHVGGYDNFTKMTDVNKAVEVFEKSFERAGKPMWENRYAAANKYYEQFKGTGPQNGQTGLAQGTEAEKQNVANAQQTNQSQPEVNAGGFGDIDFTGLPRKPKPRVIAYQAPKYRTPELGGFGTDDSKVITLLEQAVAELKGTNSGVANLNDKDFGSTNNNYYVADNTQNHNSVTNNNGGRGLNPPKPDHSGYSTAKQIAKGVLLT